MKEQIQLKDFLNYHFLSDVRYNPSGNQAAFVSAVSDVRTNGYLHSLYVWDGEKTRELERFSHPVLFTWEDDSTVLFSDIREKADQDALNQGEERTVFYRTCVHGGGAEKAFSIPLQVTAIQKAGNDTYILMVKYDLNYSHMYTLSEAEKSTLLQKKKEMEDYEILDELPFYGNGLGFINKTRNSLFLFHPSDGTLLPVSPQYMAVTGFDLDPDAGKLYYIGEQYETEQIYKDEIRCYDLGAVTDENVLPGGTYLIDSIKVWDGQLLAVASDKKTYGFNENPKFYLLNEEENKLELLYDYDDSTLHSVNSDCRLGGGRSFQTYGGKYYFITSLFNRCSIYSLDKQGTLSAVVDLEGSVDCFDIANGTILLCGMYDQRLQELYTCPVEGGDLTRVTQFNDEFYRSKDVRTPKPCNIENGGMTLYGWVLEPRNYDESKKYPAILEIHGGPKVSYGEVYHHEMQMFANAGYFVFFMNPRGSDGRGNDFIEMRGKYGTIDYEDLMKFTDKVLEAYPAIDKNRLGVCGGSYGGFMTNWIIGHTNRFAAAASQRSIANMIPHIGVSDIGSSFTVDQQGADIWDEGGAELLWNQSPLKYADKCTTPTIFLHSDEDYRCPIADGIEMFSALRRHGIDTRMVLFHGENHELSRSGKPLHRVKRLDEIKAWMDQYLMP